MSVSSAGRLAAGLPAQAAGLQVLRARYAGPGERSADDVRRRVARALAEAEPDSDRAAWAERFLQAQRAGFIVGGRVAAHAGAARPGTMMNCFVQPLADTLQPGSAAGPGIYEALAQVAQTQRWGGGVGIDFSPIRPQGAMVLGDDASAAGPTAWLRLFDTSGALLGTGSRRPCAQMGVLRCDHPDIEAFARAKAGGGLATFSLSVAVTDAFMRAVAARQTIELVHAARPGAGWPGAARRADGLWTYRQIPASQVWVTLVEQAHAHGEPGLLFVDRIHDDNNLAYCEDLTVTNPCGEQPLPAYGACCLGSIDLTRLVRHPFETSAVLDLQRLAALVPLAVRMLDNALTLSAWPLAQQREEALSKRRIGLGFTGLGDALAMLGLAYDEPRALAQAAAIAHCMRDAAYAASVGLARERGAFPRFDAAGVLRSGGFGSRLPAALQQAVRQTGLRNSHLLSIAPTGGISVAFADNVSPGIEPVLAWQWTGPEPGAVCGGAAGLALQDHALRLYRLLRGAQAPWPVAFVDALSLSPQAHLAMVAAVAPWIDGAIAKTVNLRADSGPEVVDEIFREAWRLGLKGLTVFRPGAVGQGSRPPQGARACMSAP
jgi:ribonucleoside-diphosphate reductase alpha chain